MTDKNPPARVEPPRETQECPWCGVDYCLDGGYSPAEVEQTHLDNCRIFQSLPVAELSANGTVFVEYESGILVERRRKVN